MGGDPSRTLAGLDALTASSVWVAGVAAALCAASSAVLGRSGVGAAAALAAAGTFAVYNLDHLRDLARDRATSPRRAAFVSRHRRLLASTSALALLASAGLALQLPARAVLLLVPVALAGLLHRRLKRLAPLKPFYVATAWTAVVVGLPALSGPLPPRVSWVAGVIFLSVLANVIASNLRDGEALASRWGPSVPLRLARGVALLALGLAVVAPGGVRALGWVPGALGLALWRFRAEERYGLLVVDGALGAGALATLAAA